MNQHHLRVRTGTECEIQAGRARYRPIVNVTFDGQEEFYTGEWLDIESVALAKAREISATIRAKFAAKGIEAQRTVTPANRHERRAQAKRAGHARLTIQVELRDDGKYYGVALINEAPLMHSPAFDTEAEAQESAEDMAKSIEARFGVQRRAP